MHDTTNVHCQHLYTCVLQSDAPKSHVSVNLATLVHVTAPNLGNHVRMILLYVTLPLARPRFPTSVPNPASPHWRNLIRHPVPVLLSLLLSGPIYSVVHTVSVDSILRRRRLSRFLRHRRRR